MYKMTIEVCESQKYLYFLIALKHQLFSDDFHLSLIHQDIFNEDDKLKKFHLICIKNALL